MDLTKHFKPGHTPQTELLTGQVRNAAGGGAYQVSDDGFLRRFLVLGCEGGTYYKDEAKLTQESCKAVISIIEKDPLKAAHLIIDMHNENRCPKPDPVMFALAVVFANATDSTRIYLEGKFKETVRTGYQLFRFVHYVTQFRGWGRSLKRLIRSWYDRDVDSLAYQLAKYRQREGWSHRDLLRLTHVRPTDDEQSRIFAWACGKTEGPVHPFLDAATETQSEETPTKQVVFQIHDHRLPHECVASRHKQKTEVYEALLDYMPLGALVRNLGVLSSRGVIGTGKFKKNEEVASRISDPEAIKRSRIHPVSLFLASKVYSNGRGERGSLTWNPDGKILAALDTAFYQSFKNVEPTKKKFLLGVDVSASMDWEIAGSPITAREGAAVMALLALKTEPYVAVTAFSGQLVNLPLSPKDTLTSVVDMMRRIPMGRTDCSLPIRAVIDLDLDIDVFVVYTDNETWYGSQHPIEALREYRRKFNKDAKLAVCAFTATRFSIADPEDPGTMDMVGFDPSTPQVLAEFVNGF